MGYKELNIGKDGIVTECRVNVAATLRMIRPGETRRYTREQIGPLGTVRTAVSRHNAMEGRKEYTIATEQQDTVYVISRAPTAR